MLTKNHAIIVEDELLVGLMIEEMLKDLGCTVWGIARTPKDALEGLEQGKVNLALLDINLGGTDNFSVAEECKRRGIPMIFVTGYSMSEIPDICRDWPIVPKPFSPEQIQSAIANVQARNLDLQS